MSFYSTQFDKLAVITEVVETARASLAQAGVDLVNVATSITLEGDSGESATISLSWNPTRHDWQVTVG
jgi:hypothetical protein